MNPWLPFIPCLIFAATPWCSSALALTLGLVLALGFQLKAPDQLKKYGKTLMQASIVAMGFAMDPAKVLSSGSQGVVVTFATLALSMGGGYLLGRLFRVEAITGTLISAGTGICGGSAIASLAPVLRAKNEEIAVAMATVFCLNAIALVLFPLIGRSFAMTPEQFGWFAAIAIHDTSSVVGAAAEFHPDSVAIAVTAKLTRALWIIPMILGAAFIMRMKSKKKEEGRGNIQWPWFIGLFVVAVVIHALIPPMPDVYRGVDQLGRACLKMAIFVAGAQVTRATIKAVGPRAMMMAVVLWILLSVVTLGWIRTFM